MKKFIVLSIAILGLIFVGRQIILPKIIAPKMAPKMFAKMVNKAIGVDQAAALEDGLHIYICGAGSPLPDPKRSGPCLGILAGQQAFMFDAGSVRNLSPMGFPMNRLEHIFLTHLHSDHIDSLGEAMLLNWVASGRDAPITVSGPIGTRAVVDGFNAAYRIDSTYRTAHHGTEIANPAGYGGKGEDITLTTYAQTVFENKDLTITAFPVSHAPVSPAFGYRIDYKGRSVVISGDTAFDATIAAQAKDVDVLLHEALNKDMVRTMQTATSQNGANAMAKIFADILDYHASPMEAARTAKMAGAKDLVLYHIVPPLPNDALKPMFLKGTDDEFDGKITVSEDGLIIRLPANGDTVIYEQGL